MNFWFTSSWGGLLCFGLSLVFGIYLIFWGGRRRLLCPHCAHRNAAHASYCAQCGAKLK